MTLTPQPHRVVRMTCPACGVVMNPHAEKPVGPVSASEAARADWMLGGILEEIHQCPSCGRIESRRST